MKIKRRSDSPLKKKARHGFRGYPIATVAFYGPSDERASKVVASIINVEGDEPAELQRWFLQERDVRHDPVVADEILRFVQEHGARSVVMTDRIIGCPHEEGIDYPTGEVCAKCPIWASRDRWTGEYLQ